MRLAILGAESSHAAQFAAILAGKDGSRRFADVELVGIYADKELGDSEAGVEQIRLKSSCDYFTDRFDEFVDKVDGVIITSRHGSRHLPYARPYLERGIPVWIDKPICSSVRDAKELLELSHRYRVPVCGGSSLATADEIRELAAYVRENRATVRGGHVTAPIHLDSPYEGFWFYAPHAVQMMTEVFGTEVRRVSAGRGADFVQAVYEYDEFNVSAYFGTGYTLTLYRGGYQAQPMKISTGSSEVQLDEFYQVVKSGKSSVSDREFIAPVYLIDATIKAYETGEWVSCEY